MIITAKQIDSIDYQCGTKIGVTPDYEKNLALVNAMQTDVKKLWRKESSWERTPQSADM